jgi:hypothetical protein
MPADSSSKVSRCATCRATQLPGAERCWLCGEPVSGSAEGTATGVSPTAVQQPASVPAASFSLSTLMLFVTLVSVVCGVISIAPGVGIALGLILLPVLAQTAILAHREEELGHALRPGDKIMLFFGSLGLVAIAGIAAAIAFGVTCFVGGWGGVAAFSAFGSGGYDDVGWGVAVGFILGTLAGVYVGYRALIALLKRKGIKELSQRSKIILVTAIFLAAAGAIALWYYFSFF